MYVYPLLIALIVFYLQIQHPLQKNQQTLINAVLDTLGISISFIPLPTIYVLSAFKNI